MCEFHQLFMLQVMPTLTPAKRRSGSTQGPLCMFFVSHLSYLWNIYTLARLFVVTLTSASHLSLRAKWYLVHMTRILISLLMPSQSKILSTGLLISGLLISPFRLRAAITELARMMISQIHSVYLPLPTSPSTWQMRWTRAC